VAVTPDGRRAVSSSGDRTLRAWNLESEKEIAIFTGESEMRSCVIAQDGQTIIAGEASGRVHLLRLVEADQSKPPIGEIKIQLVSNSG
jgi:WD40 repeat protein